MNFEERLNRILNKIMFESEFDYLNDWERFRQERDKLRRQAAGYGGDLRFHHFRTRDGTEVDLVIERDARIVAGLEVKAAATVRSADFRGLRKLANALRERWAGGVVLYDGETTIGFGDRLYAVPIRGLWET